MASSTPAATGSAFTFDPSVSQYNVASQAYREVHGQIEAIATGVLIFARRAVEEAQPTDPSAPAGNSDGGSALDNPDTIQGKELPHRNEDVLLLLKRAATDSMPLRWETPGGAVDPEDPTILHGAVRELSEEAGLRATRVVGEVGQGFFFFTRRGVRVCKFSFEVEVDVDSAAGGAHSAAGGAHSELPAVTLSHEHEAFMWVTEKQCHAKKVGDMVFQFTHRQQEQAILDGFCARRDRPAMAPPRLAL